MPPKKKQPVQEDFVPLTAALSLRTAPITDPHADPGAEPVRQAVLHGSGPVGAIVQILSEEGKSIHAVIGITGQWRVNAPPNWATQSQTLTVVSIVPSGEVTMITIAVLAQPQKSSAVG